MLTLPEWNDMAVTILSKQFPVEWHDRGEYAGGYSLLLGDVPDLTIYARLEMLNTRISSATEPALGKFEERVYFTYDTKKLLPAVVEDEQQRGSRYIYLFVVCLCIIAGILTYYGRAN